MEATFGSICGSSASLPYLYILPPCLALLAIDIAVRKGSKAPERLAGPVEEQDHSVSLPSGHLARTFKARQAISIFTDYTRRQLFRQDVDAYLTSSSSSSSSSVASSVTSSASRRAVSLDLRQCRTLGRSFSDSAAVVAQSQRRKGHRSTSSQTAEGKSPISPAFAEFCQALLQANAERIAKEKSKAEIEYLKRSLSSSKKARGSVALQNFCDQLLLKNDIWRAEREIRALKEEQERMKKARMGDITRAAGQMVREDQKERLVGELVKDVLDEAEGERQAIKALREEHEKEVREMVGAWRKEQKEMKREIEMMRKALEAKALEQEISNELEDRLFEGSRKKTNTKDDVEIVDEHTQEIEVGYGSDDGEETCLEDMSMVSSSSTCVDTASPSPSKSGIFKVKAELSVPRRRRAYSLCCNPPSPPEKPRKPVDPSKYVGFSFNPVFFPEAAAAAGSRPSSKMSMNDNEPARRSQSSMSNIPRARTMSGVTRPTPLRATWKA